MQIKKGATIAGLDIRMRPALLVCAEVMPGYSQEFVITCGLDGTHSAGSLHYYGLAIDIRSRDIKSKNTQDVCCRTLRSRLGIAFNVVKHKTHIHIEYNAR